MRPVPRGVETRDQREQRRLAGAVQAQQHGEGRRRDGEAHVVEREPRAIAMADVLDLEGRRRVLAVHGREPDRIGLGWPRRHSHHEGRRFNFVSLSVKSSVGSRPPLNGSCWDAQRKDGVAPANVSAIGSKREEGGNAGG